MRTLSAGIGQHIEDCLPEGWKKVRLGKLIAESQTGFACGLRDPQGVIQLRMNNVGARGAFVWDEVLRVPAEHATIARYRLVPGDVLFNNTNSTELVGKSALFEGYGEPVVFSNHFTRLRTRTDVLLPEILTVWLNLQRQAGVFAQICNRWIGQSAVKADKLLGMDFPLPSLSEQRRIATILHEQMGVLERAQDAANDQLAAVRQLASSFYRREFATLEDGHDDKVALPQVVEFLPARSLATDGDMEVDAVTTACLSELGFLPAGVKKGRMRSGHVQVCTLRPGEVLVARSNTSELVGRVSMYEGKPSQVVATDLTIRLLPRDGLRSDYLAVYLSHVYQGGYWRDVAGGASGSMKKITRAQLKALSLPVPNVEKQKELARRMQDLMRQTQELLQSVENQREFLGTLPTALLRQAFAGRL